LSAAKPIVGTAASMVGFALLNQPYLSVMPRLVPGISIQSARRCHWERDGRDKPAMTAAPDRDISGP
jgi:hypothetical protein